jgi:hypothetical protein
MAGSTIGFMDEGELTSLIERYREENYRAFLITPVDPNVLGFLGLLQVRTLWRN